LEILVSSPVEGQQLQQKDKKSRKRIGRKQKLKKKSEKPKDIKQLSLEILISAHT